MRWFAQAPANIALIKYMGKKNSEQNIPDNPSLSYTLNNLLSSVELESYPGKEDLWEPLNSPGGMPFNLSLQAQQRFLTHLLTLKKFFNYKGYFIVRSSNNFPSSSGLASSASSFAALTTCTVRALCELMEKPLLSLEEQAQLSQHGSGSSCRSFFSPWALWNENQVKAMELPYSTLIHEVILISHAEKEVPSTLAHARVKTSPLYQTRPQRALQNLRVLLTALEAKDWASAHQICWREFQEMHQLFHTCSEPFSYMSERTQGALNALQNLWQEHNDGPLVTMDAGPNIHLLYRPDQAEFALKFRQDTLVGNYDLL